MGWDRLRGHPTVVGEYLRAGARRPWRHSPFGVGCRSKTDRRYRGGHGKHPGEPSVDVLPRTRRSALAARLPPEDFGCHVHNFRKWTWQPLIPQVPGEPPHIPGPILGATRRQHSRGNAGGIGLRRGNSAIGVTVGGVADFACTTGSIRSLACGDCVSRCRSTGSSSGRRSSCSDAAADCRSLPPIDVSPPALRKQLDRCYHRSSACEKRCSSGDTAAGSTRSQRDARPRESIGPGPVTIVCASAHLAGI